MEDIIVFLIKRIAFVIKSKDNTTLKTFIEDTTELQHLSIDCNIATKPLKP